MDFWQARTESLEHLNSTRPTWLELVVDIFSAIDRCVNSYEAADNSVTYARVCGLTLLKAKNLAVGTYSLALDGLAQEAGALNRPFIEYAELLVYFRMFPERVHGATENDLPKAGERAKAIKGMYKDFREHLNAHASHSSYSHYSLAHLLEPNTGRFKKFQHMVPHVLETNIRDITVQVYLLLREAVFGLEQVDEDRFLELATTTDELKPRLIYEFELHPD